VEPAVWLPHRFELFVVVPVAAVPVSATAVFSAVAPAVSAGNFTSR